MISFLVAVVFLAFWVVSAWALHYRGALAEAQQEIERLLPEKEESIFESLFRRESPRREQFLVSRNTYGQIANSLQTPTQSSMVDDMRISVSEHVPDGQIILMNPMFKPFMIV